MTESTQHKVKISLVIPDNLQKEFRQQVIEDGYGMRGKSKWVTEAISNLLQLENFIDLVKLSEELRGFEKLETITVEKHLKKALDIAMLSVRKKHPDLEGVQSHIIRTSIMQRILRS
jgi:metal-responsive CopG/Arc/MetJ family transcriptional regulator